MNKILVNRLNECEISVDGILSKIEVDTSDAIVFIYCSHLEGLGNKDSDFDVYVLMKEPGNIPFSRDAETHQIKNIKLKKASLDIEYWPISEIYKLIDEIDESYNKILDIDYFKLVHRVRVSEMIVGKVEGEELKNRIKKSKLNDAILNCYIVESNSWYQDAISMYNSGNYVAAVDCAYYALHNAIGALNVKRGIITVKSKWISKVFLMNFENDFSMKEIVGNFYKYQLYPSVDAENIEKFIEEKLELIQKIFNSIALT
ncbi:hypothetical protein PV797_14635 [Clostridiaceae bacterium M8S5]|nr:hypothetical protein PV797_14635 [Clostridiaceae bacterium M8S5]